MFLFNSFFLSFLLSLVVAGCLLVVCWLFAVCLLFVCWTPIEISSIPWYLDQLDKVIMVHLFVVFFVISPVWVNFFKRSLMTIFDCPVALDKLSIEVITEPGSTTCPCHFFSSQFTLNKRSKIISLEGTSSYHSHSKNDLCNLIHPEFSIFII